MVEISKHNVRRSYERNSGLTSYDPLRSEAGLKELCL